MSSSVEVKCGSMRNEKISVEHCEFIRHADFCKNCTGNKDGRTESKYQKQRREGGNPA